MGGREKGDSWQGGLPPINGDSTKEAGAIRSHSTNGPSPLQMEYRNKFYIVVRSPASAGWNWAVDLDARTVRGGQATSEQAAIKAAERLIDGALAPPKQTLTLVRPARDGRP